MAAVGLAFTSMNNQEEWVPADLAAKSTGIGLSTLRALQSARELEPGVHWIYQTGKPQSPVLWNAPAIRAWQIESTRKIAASQDLERTKAARARADRIEIFDQSVMPRLHTPTEA
mgnify:FL=1